MTAENSTTRSSMHTTLSLMIMTAILVLAVVATLLLIQGRAEPVLVAGPGPATGEPAAQPISDEECPNVLDGSPKGLGCTEAAARADFTSKARAACVSKCAENKWDGKDCVRFGYRGAPDCANDVEGTECPDGGKGWQCKLGRGIAVECVCQCSSSA